MKIRIISFMIFAALAIGACTKVSTNKTDTPPSASGSVISEMRPEAARPLTEAVSAQFIDVRTPEEYAEGHADRAVNIPLDTLSNEFGRLEKNEPVYIICRTDNRSREAAKRLAEVGFSRLVVLTGGTNAWQAAGLPMTKGK